MNEAFVLLQKKYFFKLYTPPDCYFSMVVLLQKNLQDKKKKKLICAPKNLQDYKKKEAQCNSMLFLFHLKATEASDSHVKCLCYMPTFLLSFSSLLAKAFCLLAKLSQGSTAAAETSTAFILVQFPASFVVHTKN